MFRRRRHTCAVAVALLGLLAPACSLITDVPDLTSGSADVGVGVSDAGDAGIDVRDASMPVHDAGGDAAFCAPHTFTYDPKGRALNTVHVAGSFNGYPKTIAAGGWPLVKSGATWTLTRNLPSGRNLYKIVLNETEWILDPANPNMVPDGKGNTNSFIDVTCANDH